LCRGAAITTSHLSDLNASKNGRHPSSKEGLTNNSFCPVGTAATHTYWSSCPAVHSTENSFCNLYLEAWII
jgi:hypothetical protein